MKSIFLFFFLARVSGNEAITVKTISAALQQERCWADEGEWKKKKASSLV